MQSFRNLIKLLKAFFHRFHVIFSCLQDFVTVARGIRNCLWLQSPNIVKVKETDVLKETKAKHRQSNQSTQGSHAVKVAP